MNHQQILWFLLMVKVISAREIPKSFSIETFNEKNASMNVQIQVYTTKLEQSLPFWFFGGSQRLGHLAIANPIDACTIIRNPPDISYVDKWVVLIEDNTCLKDCPLHQKVFNAQNAGYSAAIIYNPKLTKYGQYVMSDIYRTKYKIVIPSVFVDPSDFVWLKNISYENKS